MYNLQYLVPPGHPLAPPSFDKKIMDMCSALKGVDKRSVPVPCSALSIQLFLMLDGASIEIKKRDQLAYLNFLCFEIQNAHTIFFLVEEYYRKYNLGTPQRPTMPTWIHSIPANASILRDNEIIFCQKMTVSFYWAAYAQLLKKRNPLN